MTEVKYYDWLRFCLACYNSLFSTFLDLDSFGGLEVLEAQSGFLSPGFDEFLSEAIGSLLGTALWSGRFHTSDLSHSGGYISVS